MILLEITPWIVFRKIVCLEIMCDDLPVRTRAHQDYKKADFTKWPYWIFFKGVNPRFWSKIGNYSLVWFWIKQAKK